MGSLDDDLGRRLFDHSGSHPSHERRSAAAQDADLRVGSGPRASADAAARIAEACASLVFDKDALFAAGAKAGTLAIPLVKELTGEVRKREAAAAAWVHFGATSQDVLDTALVLQLDGALALIEADLARLAHAAARLARRYRATPMLGRTLLQPGSPITFGLKAAQWLAAAADSYVRLRRSAAEALVVQFGGAAGTLGSLGSRAEDVARLLNGALAPKRVPASGEAALPWHTRRGALVALAAELGILTGVCAKIARDVSLMMQFELSEAMEPNEAGRGGSSAMPHKRNPVRCMLTLSASLRAPQLVAVLLSALVQEHERALGGWQAEWAALPELVKLCGGALANMADALEGLVVDEARLRADLDVLRGLPMTEMISLALAQKIGRDEAHQVVEEAARKTAAGSGSLADALAADERVTRHLSREEIERVLDPANAQGATQKFIDLALERWDRRLGGNPPNAPSDFPKAVPKGPPTTLVR